MVTNLFAFILGRRRGYAMRSAALSFSAVLATLIFASVSAASVLPFFAHGTGPFTVTPLSATLFEENQTLAFDSSQPFPLTTGVYQDRLDLTAVPLFPNGIVFSSFTLSDGAGNALFGSYTIETSDFPDPIDPASGDIVGIQDFGGHFTFTGGLGAYLGATGGGTYAGRGEFLLFDPADYPGAILVGTGEYTARGVVSLVPEPASLLLIGLGLVGLGLFRIRSLRPDDQVPE